MASTRLHPDCEDRQVPHGQRRALQQVAVGAGGRLMSREAQQFKLRMPPALRAQIEQAAKAAHRSLNAEITIRLEASFQANADSEPLTR